MEEVDGEELVESIADEMENMLGRKMKSVKVRKTHTLIDVSTQTYKRVHKQWHTHTHTHK